MLVGVCEGEREAERRTRRKSGRKDSKATPIKEGRKNSKAVRISVGAMKDVSRTERIQIVDKLRIQNCLRVLCLGKSLYVHGKFCLPFEKHGFGWKDLLI